jgi:hypothetical protein
MKSNWVSLLIVSAIFVLGALIACSRDGDVVTDPSDSSDAESTFTEVYSIFSQAGCLASNCHGSSSGPNAPILNSQSNAYSNLVGKTSNCSGKTYVVANNTASSYLVEKLSSSPSCGTRMPQNNTSYFDTNSSQLQTIKDWINRSAPND